VITCGDIATDFISALFTGTQFDIAASDQINPIATTVVIPIHLLILHPLCGALSLDHHLVAYFFASRL
jgi:hypothetical protein